MLNVLNKLPFNGYKTYICLAVAVVLTGMEQLGYLSPGTYNEFMTWVTLAGGVSLAHKIDKSISAPVIAPPVGSQA